MKHTGRILLTALTLTAGILIFSAETSARKKGFRLTAKATKTDKTELTEIRSAAAGDTAAVMTPAPGCFVVTSECGCDSNSYRLSRIVFTGFDKNQNSAKESFFIINNTDRALAEVSLHIEYLTPDGRQLHKQFVRLSCNIPPGETRKADIPTWDTQRSFYYHKSVPSRKGGNPFVVRFHPIACILRL